MYDHNEFDNKYALVTGASGSIGHAIAETLHKHGAHVVISGTNHQKLEKLSKKLGSKVTIRVCDLRKKEDCIKMVSEIDFLDILVCNAGITSDSLILRMSEQHFEDVMNVNLFSSFLLNREATKKMIRRKFGRIINISSIVGHTGNPGQVNYAASKAGITGLTKSLAYEVASRGITVNCIAPGFIQSDMTDKLSEEHKSLLMNKIPMKSFGNAQNVADASLFLASSKASYITGQTLHVNGGMAMF